ncbi:MAG: hypothetical protein WC655_21460, partial [Candidatus Hydrogenedentales bacterium]
MCRTIAWRVHGVLFAAAFFSCALHAETLPFERLTFETRDAFRVIGGIEGGPSLGDVLGGPERDLIWIRFPERIPEAGQSSGNSDNDNGKPRLIAVTVVDGSGKSALRFEDTSLSAGQWPSRVTIGGLPK